MSLVVARGRPEPTVRRRPSGPSLGPVPLVGVVVVEIGLAAAVALVAADRRLLPLAGVVLSAGIVVGLLRVRRRWLVEWIGLALRFRLRVRERVAEPLDAGTDPRLRVLRLLTGDLTVARTRDHDGREVGLLGHGGGWSAVLALDPTDLDGGARLVAPDAAGDATSFPLAAVAGCLADRGVVLDAVSALWHCRPLATESPAAAAYREVLGPLPPLARREAWLVVRLDPQRCPDAVAERGGGVVGAHRAVVGALARISRVLADHGTPVRPLGADDVLDAATGAADSGDELAERLTEHWRAVVVGEVGHASYAVTRWPTGMAPDRLSGLTATSGRSCTLALTLEPDPRGDGDGAPTVGLRGTARITADTPEALDEAGGELVARGHALGIALDPLDGRHAAGLAATLPVGAVP
ncbi:type VII secretion protein EccE [Actinomycetospora sp. NBRC 106375]|uniref:type VII secretion protein EccE n=1 Tax=Actinomycetospora sp. NBRC 106375 TaxID=3032207 RepID=UPI0024A4D8BB|nr:type VII secretion protein EccE [Actinomycetospora sp. NBRC 106375]GLZ44610.1 type VII secretion protein EccE [Actinomycetospora sp. NBRC 106375]